MTEAAIKLLQAELCTERYAREQYELTIRQLRDEIERLRANEAKQREAMFAVIAAGDRDHKEVARLRAQLEQHERTIRELYDEIEREI